MASFPALGGDESPPTAYLFQEPAGKLSSLAERTQARLAAKALHRGTSWGNDIELTASRGRGPAGAVHRTPAEQVLGMPLSGRGADISMVGSGRRHYNSPSMSPVSEIPRTAPRPGSGAEMWRLPAAGSVDRSAQQADMVREAKVQRNIGDVFGKPFRGRTSRSGSRRWSRSPSESPSASPCMSARGLNRSASADSSPRSRASARGFHESDLTPSFLSNPCSTPPFSKGLGHRDTPRRSHAGLATPEAGLAVLARRARSQDPPIHEMPINGAGDHGAGRKRPSRRTSSLARPKAPPPRNAMRECRVLWRPGRGASMKNLASPSTLQMDRAAQGQMQLGGDEPRLASSASATGLSRRMQAAQPSPARNDAARCSTSIGSMVQEKLDMLFQELDDMRHDHTDEKTACRDGSCLGAGVGMDSFSTSSTTAGLTSRSARSSCQSSPNLAARELGRPRCCQDSPPMANDPSPAPAFSTGVRRPMRSMTQPNGAQPMFKVDAHIMVPQHGLEHQMAHHRKQLGVAQQHPAHVQSMTPSHCLQQQPAVFKQVQALLTRPQLASEPVPGVMPARPVWK